MNNYKDLIDNSILRYLDEIDFDEDNLYEVILLHLVNGDLDDIYRNKILDKLNDEDRVNLLNKAGTYINLCFKDGDYLKYEKSVDTPIKDKELKFNLLLNNYDLLIKIAYKDENILKELSKYREYKEFNKTSVIDTIKTKFLDDDLLIKCLSNFIKTDNLYNLFDEKKRSLLYLNPNGNMYKGNDMYSSLDIAVNIYNKVNKKRMTFGDDKESLDILYDFINSKDYKFEDVIS